VDKEGDVTHPTNLINDIKQGSEDPASNDKEVLDFPGDEGNEIMDLDVISDDGMPDLVILDMCVPDVVVPDSESYATTKMTQVGVGSVNPGVSMLTGAYRIVREVL
jgi:hypothetical protein